MQKFFLLLLKINGVILLLLSLVIVAQLWFSPMSNSDFFGKVIGSYLVVIVNFYVLATVSKQATRIESKDEERSS